MFNDCEAIIYDGDNTFIGGCVESACLSHKAITWSRTDSEAPLYIESIKKLESETIIRCTLLGFDRTYTIPFTDDASIENVIHCMAVMLYLKPTSVNDVEKFKCLEPVAMRLDVKQGINNCPVDKRHLQFGHQFFGYRPRLPAEPPRRKGLEMHADPF